MIALHQSTEQIVSGSKIARPMYARDPRAQRRPVPRAGAQAGRDLDRWRPLRNLLGASTAGWRVPPRQDV